MSPRYLLDTQVAVRWVVESRKLSREQIRIIEQAEVRREPVAVCAMSLLEIAALEESGRIRASTREIFHYLQSSPLFTILPISYEIAEETTFLSVLRDPADRAIVATARVHRLKLLTSDQKIIESKLVAVVE